MIDQKIRRTSTILLVLGGGLATYLVAVYAYGMIVWVWSDPFKLAYGFGYRDGDLAIPFGTRVLYTLLQSLPVIAGLLTLGFGAKLMLGFRRAEYFDTATTKAMWNCGLSLMAVGFVAIFVRTLSGPLVSQHFPVGKRFVSLSIDSYDLGFLLAGLMFSVTGWVLTRATELQKENESFV